jgi:hypothetical protein
MTRIAELHKWRRCYRIQQIAVLLTLLCVFVNLAVEGANITEEGWALLAFKRSISDERGVLGAWKAEEGAPHPCEWYGISCEKNFHISTINLRNSGLFGTISPELHRLRKLRILDLSKNRFTRRIPSQLSEISKCDEPKSGLLTEFISFVPMILCETLCMVFSLHIFQPLLSSASDLKIMQLGPRSYAIL